jgi:hypothetical protein
MHLPTGFRSSRGGRLFTVAAIAAVVLLAPTAGAGAALGSTAPPGAPTGHDTGRSGQAAARAVEPVGNTAEPADDERNDDRDTAAEDRNAGRNDDDRNAGRNDERGRVESTGTAEPENDASSAESASAPAGDKNGDNNGLDVLGRDCTDSDLDSHDGFQKSPACVSTQMGEVAAEDKLPSLLITAAPETVEVDRPFELKVSTRNLVRDRFLGAAEGGYYLESSFLDDNGLQRGHFHTACRLLSSTSEAPDSGKAPEFFLATQDNKGDGEPDTVTIEVPGIRTAGELQCTSWAGDGSHRTPMMTKPRSADERRRGGRRVNEESAS